MQNVPHCTEDVGVQKTVVSRFYFLVDNMTANTLSFFGGLKPGPWPVKFYDVLAILSPSLWRDPVPLEGRGCDIRHCSSFTPIETKVSVCCTLS